MSIVTTNGTKTYHVNPVTVPVCACALEGAYAVVDRWELSIVGDGRTLTRDLYDTEEKAIAVAKCWAIPLN